MMSFRKAVLLSVIASLSGVDALNGGQSDTPPIQYTAGVKSSLLSSNQSHLSAQSSLRFSRASYQYTGFGSAESNLFFTKNGSLLYSPAFSNEGVGYAISHDDGQTWDQVLPGGPKQPRAQPVLALAQNRQFFWSSTIPGLNFQYSDDEGKSWTKMAKGFMSAVGDWVKLIEAPPVYSKLQGGATKLLYLSAPSNLSTPAPIASYVMKSSDRGTTWQMCPGQLPLNPSQNGGACKGKDNNEIILWGAGIARKNGTVMIGLRHCTKLGIAMTHDEGNTWSLMEVPGSNLPAADAGIISYAINGNMVMPDPISQDLDGNIYAIWSDANYVLKMTRSTDDGLTWSTPIEIAAPLAKGTMMTYLPKIRHHPSTAGRTAVAYYGSPDGGTTWNAYIAETGDITAARPIFTTIKANPGSAPMQKNTGGGWDQGYLDPFYDLVEFLDLDYAPKGDKLVAAYARKMCAAFSQGAGKNPKVCADEWVPAKHGDSAWQGVVFTVDFAPR